MLKLCWINIIQHNNKLPKKYFLNKFDKIMVNSAPCSMFMAQQLGLKMANTIFTPEDET